jgi:hypothetical protein
MLDVHRQCVKPRRLKPDSPLLFYDLTILVDLYATVSDSPQRQGVERLVAGLFTDWSSLISGAWEVVGHEDVDPTIVEFPEALMTEGPDPRFVRGELYLPLQLTFHDVTRINVHATIRPSGTLSNVAAYYLERRRSQTTSDSRDDEKRGLARSDLRFSPHRAEVYRALSEDEHQTYFEVSLRHGLDIRRFYA